MYTEINGKEVRVNTLPKRIIDSLEALPPAKKLFAIYRVEKVDRAIEQNQPAETHTISEFDYWLDKRVERIYKVYRNVDGTTRIEDNSGNWMLFNTEYVVNEYTGEKSTTPISGKKYCGFGGKKDVVLLAAHRVLPNGYKLEVDSYNKTVTMTYIPLGISYETSKNRVLSGLWYEWISESKYYDALERTLYNGVLSGISIDGGKFFYPNPLQSMGQHQRQAWFGCACCPSNVARFIPSFPQYIYAVKDDAFYVNLFASNETTVKINGKAVTIQQTTNYPWDGDIQMTMKKANSLFALKIRIPGWVRGQVVPSDLYNYTDGKHLSYTITVNGEIVNGQLENGYFVINRKWKAGDKVEVHFDMEPRLVRANGQVAADKGRAAIERGPLVYCAEWADNTCDVLSVLLNQEPQYQLGHVTIANTDVLTLTTDAQTLKFDARGRLTTTDERLTLIPYYAWAHRGNGNMAVWLPIDLSASKPALPPSIASQSTISAIPYSERDMPFLL